jgi:peptidoglycan LD-endopeptidase CwlK
MKLTQRDEQRLIGVHPDLVRVIRRAAATTTLGFTVLEGVRTLERQRQLVKQGASRTLRSRHIPGPDGLAKAVDIAPLLSGKVSWDWPLYHRLAVIVKAAAAAENVPIEWGGDWRTFKDGPHWQLPWRQYP